MTTIIIFASSLFISLALILFKAIELKYGKRNIILELLNKFDSKSVALVSTFKFRSLQLVQSVRYIILVQSKIMFKELVDRVMEKIINEYKIRQSIMMGHKEIANNGSASFYLRKITDFKGDVRKGKIEESF